MEKTESKISLKFVILWIVLILVLTFAALFTLGRIPICECGYVKLWHGETVSSENSQHIFDPYTFTHIIHGFLFYFLLSIFAKRADPRKRLIIVILLESLWEIFENTDFVIQRYREATISLDYYGDSIINSLGDILASIIGFIFAREFPVWASAAAIIIIEIILALSIRDSLILNIIMLIYPVEAIKLWQFGG